MQESQTLQSNLEKIILSAIIFDSHALNSNLIEDHYDDLKIEYFQYPENRHIYEICLSLQAQDLPLDPEIIKNRLDPKKTSQEYFLSILNTSPVADINGYITSLKETATRRLLKHLSMNLSKQSQEYAIPIQEILNDIERDIYSISMENTNNEFKNSVEIIASTLETIKNHKELGNRTHTGIASGFIDLDRITTGFNKGDLVIIGARPSMGKTALFLSMACHVLKNDLGVAVFSLEMAAEQLMLRILSSLASIPLQKLKTGDLDDNEFGEMAKWASYMEKKKLFIDDSGNLTLPQLRSKLRKLKSKQNEIQVAFIDYLQLMNPSKSKERHLEISEISRGLKVLARELQIPIIALSQLNRSLEAREDKRPILSDLRESGSIEQDADIILFLYRDSVYHIREINMKIAKLERENKLENYKEKTKKAEEEPIEKLRKELAKTLQNNTESADIIIAKNRNGETREIQIQFNKRLVRFNDIAKESEVAYGPTKWNESPVSMPFEPL